MARKELKKFTSPVGIYKYPALIEPDFGTDEFPNKDGAFKTGLMFDEGGPEALEMIKMLQPEWDAAKAAAEEEFANLKPKQKDALAAKNITEPVMNPMYSRVYDRETEEPTGQIEFKFKRKYSGIRKKDNSKWFAQRPAMYDARLNLIPKNIPIWGGTKGSIRFEVSPYFIPASGAAGISLKLLGGQVIELVTRGAVQSAESMGYTAQEGTDVTTIQQSDDEPQPNDAAEGGDDSAPEDNTDF